MITISILFILLSNAVTSRRDISIVFNRIAIIVLIYCILQDIISLPVITKGVGLHGGLLHKTNITQIFNIFIFLISILILQLTSFYPIKLWIKNYIPNNWNYLKGYINNFNIVINKIMNTIKINEHLKIIEYPLILLFIITGAIFLMAANDLISIFLAIELQSYGLYLLSTIYRNSELSTIGGLMYFLLGGLSSCFILLGTGLLYANSGTTNLDTLYIITSISDVNNLSFWYKPFYINFAFLIISLGFLFKVSAAPFHFWSPDVYDAIPTIVTVFVAIVSKISIFIFLLELVYYTNNNYSILYNVQDMNWTFGLLISSFFSLIIGTLVGLTQFRIKRLFAYSTISHIGFILLGIAISSVESTQAFIFYLVQYSISNLNAFLIIIAIGFSLYTYINKSKEYEKLTDKYNSPIQLISQLRGYFYINPILSISLTITIFSFMGIPPLIGFFGKQMILSAALDKGFIFLTLIAITTSVIGAVYYLNIIKEVFFYNSEYKINPIFETLRLSLRKINFSLNIFPVKVESQVARSSIISIKHDNLKISSSITIVISIITWIIMLFMFFNKEWLSMGTILVQILFNY